RRSFPQRRSTTPSRAPCYAEAVHHIAVIVAHTPYSWAPALTLQPARARPAAEGGRSNHKDTKAQRVGIGAHRAITISALCALVCLWFNSPLAPTATGGDDG